MIDWTTLFGVIASQLLDSQGSLNDVRSELQHALFGADARIHDQWWNLFGSDGFSFREGLTHQERIDLSYGRLRLAVAEVPDPCALALDPAALSAVHEHAGVADAGMATMLSIHVNLFLGSLLDHDHAERDLTPYVRMDRIGTFLCTERDHGNDALQLETTATLDRESGGFVLHTPTPGAAKYMPNTSSSGGAKDGLVAARLIIDGEDHGVFLFLTPLTDDTGRHLPGVHVHRLPQTAGSPVDHCETVFDHVRLPHSALLQGEHGRLTPQGGFTSSLGSPRARFLRSIGRVTMGKLCMSAYSVGTMRHAVTVAVRHAHDRITSAGTSRRRVPLFAHRSHHAPLLDAITTAYGATLLQRLAVRTWVQAPDAERGDAERLTAVAKGWITWSARRVMTECRERCGAHGLKLSTGIAYQLAANEGTITAEGDNVVIWAKAAGEMLLGGYVARPVAEVPPEDRTLSNSLHLQNLLVELERLPRERAQERLRSRDAGKGLDRWNTTVTPALQFVGAHAHRLAAEELLRAAQEAGSPQARSLLGHVHRLFALRQLAAHSGELLADGRLTADQVRQLPDAIEDTVVTLQPHALSLVAAFDDFGGDEPPRRHPLLGAEEAGEAVLV
ncbi:acyl-CoA dehydrogenase [Streptomyces sp. NPDC026672]|uniref:acyl-CoA dehydrogenase family protein n=1 Tax=unclassified Streptomyces TaxID=2593676 RepID=UPI0033C1B4E8